jgi:hypothetical protein
MDKIDTTAILPALAFLIVGNVTEGWNIDRADFSAQDLVSIVI